MDPCDLIDIGVEEYAQGAKDLLSFAEGMKRKFGKDVEPDVLDAMFKKAAERYESHMAPVEQIKAEIAKELMASRKSGLLETITAVRRAGLLTGPATTVRNLTGNALAAAFDEVSRIPGSMVDIAMSLYTKNRTYAGVDPIASANAVSDAVTKGTKNFLSIMKSGATPEQLNKYDFLRELNFKVGDINIKPVNWYVNMVQRWQGAIDAPARQYAFTRSLYEQARFAAKGDKEMLKQLLSNPTEEMMIKAAANTEEAVFANQNPISKALGGFRSAHPVLGFTVDTLIPFQRVPTNIAGRLLESTPVGTIKLGQLLFKGIKNPEVQREFAKTFGRSSTGTSLIFLGYKLAEEGILTPTDPFGESGRETSQTTGIQGGTVPGGGIASVLFGDSRVSLKDNPATQLLVIGADIHKEFKDNPDTSAMEKLATGFGKSASRQILDLPIMQGVEDLARLGEGIRGRDKKAFSKYGANLAGSFVPSVVSTVAQGTDENYRRPSNPKEGVQARMPGLRENLPVQHDAFGRPMPSHPWYNPFAAGTPKNDPVTKEVVRLGIILRKPTRVTDEDSPSRDVDEADYQQRVKFIGGELLKRLTVLVESDEYKEFDDTQKERALNAAITRHKGLLTKAYNSMKRLKKQEQ